MCAAVTLNTALTFASLGDGLLFFSFIFSGFTLYVFGLYVYMDCGAGALYSSYSVEIMTIWVRLLLLFINVVVRKCTEMNLDNKSNR